jgi:Golgi nucleoside diphosphatase
MYGKSTGFTMGDRFNINELTGALKNGKIRNDKLISNIRKYERLSTTDFSSLFSPDKKDLKESFEELLNRIENPVINKKLKESYLESLTDLGYAYGYDKEKLAEIEKKLKSLSNEEFEKLFTEDIGMQRVFSYYDILKMNMGSNFLDNQEDVFSLYDNIYDNLDEIIANSKV